jgi:hypothetical protein
MLAAMRRASSRVEEFGQSWRISANILGDPTVDNRTSLAIYRLRLLAHTR